MRQEDIELLVKVVVGIAIVSILGFIIYSFTPYSIFSNNTVFKSTDVDFLIESEYRNKMSKLIRIAYENYPAFLKKKYLDKFKASNPTIVERAKRDALQNAVNNTLASVAGNVNGNMGSVYGNATAEVKSILQLTEEPFNITLNNGKVINVKPVVGQVRIWKSDKEPGFVMYDLVKTINNIMPVIESQLSGLGAQESSKVRDEALNKIVKTLKEYETSKYKAAAISAVATAISK